MWKSEDSGGQTVERDEGIAAVKPLHHLPGPHRYGSALSALNVLPSERHGAPPSVPVRILLPAEEGVGFNG